MPLGRPESGSEQAVRMRAAERKMDQAKLIVEIAKMLQGRTCEDLRAIEAGVREVLGVAP